MKEPDVTSAATPPDWNIFAQDELTPAAWGSPGQIPHIFNNALHRHEGALVMAYRVVTSDGRRHIATCRLHEDWTVVPGSVQPFSDHLVYAPASEAGHGRPDWVADPRFVTLQGRLYLHFNTGSIPTPNRIFLVKVDPVTLRPAGPARELVRGGSRQEVEKNWMLFGHGDAVYVIYSFAPLVILRADMTDAEYVRCSPAFRHDWDSACYEDSYGQIRGGATPVEMNGRLHFICHSAFRADQGPNAGSEPDDICYVAPLVVLEAMPPFAPLLHSSRPVLEATARELALPFEPRLDSRCRETVYPVGAVADGVDIVVSYGLSNQYAVLRRMSAWVQSLVPVLRHGQDEVGPLNWLAAGRDPSLKSARKQLRASWWRSERVSARDPERDQRLGAGNFVHGNFGDYAVPPIVGRITGLPIAPPAGAGPMLYTIGSLIQILSEGDAVWGTGLNGGTAELWKVPRELHVFATRGPISLEFLRRHGFDTRRVSRIFDPGSLVGALFADEIAWLRAKSAHRRRNFILIPHYRDECAMRRIYAAHADHIVSVDTPFLELLGEILSADLVVSSSLHGLVMAEALGVPAVWHRPLMGEDELKFNDYYLGTDRWRILRADNLTEALRATPMRLPVFDTDAMLATFPSAAELEALGILVPARPMPLDTPIRMSAPPPNMRLLSGWSPPEPHGVWTIGSEAVMEIELGELAKEALVLDLTLHPFIPGPGKPQLLQVVCDGGVLLTHEFLDAAPRQFSLPLRAIERNEEQLSVVFRIGSPASPASLGNSGDRRRLGVSLNVVQLRRDRGD